MQTIEALLRSFVGKSAEILGDAISGIYLHGSAVMGCFHPKKSDIDLIVVVKGDIPAATKRRFLDMVVEHNQYAPSKGIELSIVKEEYCKPFVYPTPFELHFSIAHLAWYQRAPKDYIEKMNGTDPDLAAHFTIIYHRGKCLYGKPIREVFGAVDKAAYFGSICSDIANANADIVQDPVYVVLNLCRVLAYKQDGQILSKEEGGQWGLAHLPPEYHPLLAAALDDYSGGEAIHASETALQEFAGFMLREIR